MRLAVGPHRSRAGGESGAPRSPISGSDRTPATLANSESGNCPSRAVSELALYWEELGEEKYDWAKLAMLYWPDRVRERCRTDKSLAIAHNLDSEYFPGLRDELRGQAERTASVTEDEAVEPGDADETGDEEDEG